MRDAEGRCPTFAEREKLADDTKADEARVPGIVGAAEMNKEIIMQFVQHAGADIADGVTIETLWAARIAWMGSAVLGRVKIDIGVLGEKAIGPTAQIVVAQPE